MRPRGPARGWAFWLLLPGVFFEAFGTLRVSGAVTLGDALILGSGVLAAIDSARGGTRLWFPWWILLGLPLFAAGPVLDALFGSGGSRDDVVHALTLVFCIFITPVVIASQRPESGTPEWLLLAWVAGLATGAIIAWLQFHNLTPDELGPWLGRSGNRVAGLNSNPNILGEALAIVAPLYVALALDSRSWLRAGAWCAVWALSFHVADLTGSRASIGGAAAGSLACIGLFALRTRAADLPRRLAQVLVLVVAVGAFLALRRGYYDSAIERLFGHSQTGFVSSWIRQQLAEAAFHTFGDSPFFGNGYGHLTYKAHNVPLVLLQCGGLFGLAGFLLAQIGFALVAVRTYLHSRLTDLKPAWALGLPGVWVAWLAVSMFQFPILHRHGHIAFGLSVLWWAVAQRQRLREPPLAAPAWRALPGGTATAR